MLIATLQSNSPHLLFHKSVFKFRTALTIDLSVSGLSSRVQKKDREILLFRLFNPDRLREAAVGTGWEVAEVRHGSERTYTTVLEKSE